MTTHTITVPNTTSRFAAIMTAAETYADVLTWSIDNRAWTTTDSSAANRLQRAGAVVISN